MQLTHVATNGLFRNILEIELTEVREALMKLAPGSDVTQFMLDYAVTQKRKEDLEEMVDFLDYVLRDIETLTLTGETES